MRLSQKEKVKTSKDNSKRNEQSRRMRYLALIAVRPAENRGSLDLHLFPFFAPSDKVEALEEGERK